MARNHSKVEWCLRRLLCAGFLAFAVLALTAPGWAADEYDATLPAAGGAAEVCSSSVAAPGGASEVCNSTLAAPVEAVGEYDRIPEEPCGYWDQWGRAPQKPCIWDGYDSKEAGHPLRIAAYLLHPVGVIIDWVIFRPAWWIGSHDPFYTLFGRTD